MKFSTALFSSALLASTCLAAPLTEARRARRAASLEARGRSTRASNPKLAPVNGTTLPDVSDETSHVSYSENWAGAVLVGTGYYYVTGTFTVPTPSVPSGDSSSDTYAASAWVGIDGDTCYTAILQTGVDFTISDGEVSYDAWYEWYPDYAYDFSDITISAGDVIKVTVDATSDTGGTATIENETTGTTVTHTFSDETDGSLCEYNAEWIVEDFEENGSLVDFADFGTVTFTDAYAKDASGEVGLTDADVIDIEQNNEVLTSVTIESSSEVVIKYV